MKLYFGGDHFLMQYALVLVSLERYEEAVVALNICMKENELAHYLASNILINYLGNVSACRCRDLKKVKELNL